MVHALLGILVVQTKLFYWGGLIFKKPVGHINFGCCQCCLCVVMPKYNLKQCCVNSIHIEETKSKDFENEGFSVVESFQVQNLTLRYEGFSILGVLGLDTVPKPKINLKPTNF